MLNLKVTKREKLGKRTESLRRAGILPGVLYGEGVKNTPIEVNERDFEKALEEAGTTSLVELELEGKKHQALIHEISRNSVSDKVSHIDFFCPSTKKEIEAEIPLVFDGEAPAEKDLGGNLLKEIQILKVKGLVKDLPREIKVDVSGLKSFEERILVKDLNIPAGITVLKDKEEIVALVVPIKEEKEEAPAPAATEEKPAEEITPATEGENPAEK